MESKQLQPIEYADTPDTLRRDPKQARSRALIEAILEAVNRLTEDHELQISTKRIAEVAGVSIGSLYQYFPSKDALLGTWWRNLVRARVSGLLNVVDASNGLPLRAALERLVDHAIAARAGEGSERAILRAYRLFGNDEMLRAIDAAVVHNIAQLLRTHAHETRELDPELSAFVMVFAVRWVLLAASFVPGALKQQALRDELVHLLTAYVAKPSP